ncbi:MAG: DNA repair protein RadA [Gemmatimonadetes bacterium]|nr:DNA repair protein RadA [Gemmatimonadota bacterium]|tara:strand:+ start:200 stop:1573 length:1374 start_codon:yes stop_codon:yes gene_type:complete
MAKKRSSFVCQSCGHSAARWFGRCSGCGEWNTCVEERPQEVDKRREHIAVTAPRSELQPITEVDDQDHERLQVGIGEFDRVLGGGIMPGSVVLVGGDPGIGKSTILLQMVGQLAASNFRIAYISAEESAAQIRLRAGRLGALSEDLQVMAETNLNAILDQLKAADPVAIVIDSIQTIYMPELESAPGSVTQVRECAARLVYLAKESGIPVFLVGHVTKEGTVAGPRVLEHLVDTVLYLEGERHHHFRILRAAKNRFGSTNEIGIFEMRDQGLIEVANPSEILLAERAEGVSGSAIVCSMEGTRPLLIEIQALVSRSSFGYPQRVATGIDAKRLSIIIAVLEKRCGHDLSGEDIFVNVVGGMRLDEPSVDMGVGLAIVSSFRNRPIDAQTVAIGEVGLGGEIRPVNQIDRRVTEARSLGFERCLVARSNLKGWKRPEGMEVVGVGGLEAAEELAFGAG